MDEQPSLCVAFAPGVTVTKWSRIWAERHPHIPLTLSPTDQSQQISVVLDGTAQLSFVRLPVEVEGLNVIPLYRERAVAVAAKDHLIAAADSVTLADLDGEALHSAGTKHADRDAFDLVAAGVGVLVVPQSIARLFSRKDVVVRPVTDAPETQIALVWRSNPDAEGDATPNASGELIAEFIGIVRGRTAQSSRSAVPHGDQAKKKQPVKANGESKSDAKASDAARRSGAAHAVNRKRADFRKKRRGR